MSITLFTGLDEKSFKDMTDLEKYVYKQDLTKVFVCDVCGFTLDIHITTVPAIPRYSITLVVDKDCNNYVYHSYDELLKDFSVDFFQHLFTDISEGGNYTLYDDCKFLIDAGLVSQDAVRFIIEYLIGKIK